LIPIEDEASPTITINPLDHDGNCINVSRSLALITDLAEPKRTLADVITCNEIAEEKVYRMGLNEKSFEVKTKLVSPNSNKSWKIAVIQDQTVYETLIKEQLVEKYQRMLLSSIAHEIRNPLNAIEGYLKYIIEEKGLQYERVKKFCLKINSSSQQISFMLDGACDLLLSNNKTLILQPMKFDVQKAIEDVIKMYIPSIDAKGLRIFTKVTGKIPKCIFSDMKRYQSILFQLLANAVKYTDLGEIIIECSFEYDNKLLITRVSDTGCGILPDAATKLFKLYSNIHKANVYNPQGMGLGLTLCEKLSKILGGEISFYSQPDKGSQFTFSIKDFDEASCEISPMLQIPIAGIEGSNLQNIKLYFPERGSGSKGMKPSSQQQRAMQCGCKDVLIVDDEPTNRIVLKYYLETTNLTCDEASNGLEALEKVDSRLLNECCCKYRLIVMDINMPVMDGTEATEKLIELFQNNPDYKSPIIAVTAANLQTRDDIQKLLDIGFSEICIF